MAHHPWKAKTLAQDMELLVHYGAHAFALPDAQMRDPTKEGMAIADRIEEPMEIGAVSSAKPGTTQPLCLYC